MSSTWLSDGSHRFTNHDDVITTANRCFHGRPRPARWYIGLSVPVPDLALNLDRLIPGSVEHRAPVDDQLSRINARREQFAFFIRNSNKLNGIMADISANAIVCREHSHLRTASSPRSFGKLQSRRRNWTHIQGSLSLHEYFPKLRISIG